MSLIVALRTACGGTRGTLLNNLDSAVFRERTILNRESSRGCTSPHMRGALATSLFNPSRKDCSRFRYPIRGNCLDCTLVAYLVVPSIVDMPTVSDCSCSRSSPGSLPCRKTTPQATKRRARSIHDLKSDDCLAS